MNEAYITYMAIKSFCQENSSRNHDIYKKSLKALQAIRINGSVDY